MGYDLKLFTPEVYDPTKNGDYSTAKSEKEKIYSLLSGKYIDSEGKLIPQTTSVDDALSGYLQDYQKRNEKGFSYDFNADALYQQYKDKYIQQGKMAMQDTMGQAAAMTGGYGNSYAQSVGQQAYQASLDNLNDIIPELYQMAYDRYNQEGQDMLNTISLLRGERDNEYAMYNDGYSKLMDMLGYYTNEEQNAYERGYTEHSDAQRYAYQAVADTNAFNQWYADYLLDKKQVDLAEQQYADSKKAYDTGSVSGSGNTDGGGNDEGGNIDNTPVGGVTEAIRQRAATFKTNEELASYLNGLEAQGILSPEESLSVYSEYMIPEEVALNERKWKKVKDGDGGINWFGGVDNNAVVEDQYGNQYKLGKLVDALVASGIEKSAAKEYVINQIQKKLGL